MGKASSPADKDCGLIFAGVGVAGIPGVGACGEDVTPIVGEAGRLVGVNEACTAGTLVGVTEACTGVTLGAGVLAGGVLRRCPEHPLIKNARRMKTLKLFNMFIARAQ
jgi:hypothetical protein